MNQQMHQVPGLVMSFEVTMRSRREEVTDAAEE